VAERLFAPEPISSAHRAEGFECGVASLDDWLKRRAVANQLRHFSQVFVIAAEDHSVAAYYALSTGAVFRSLAPATLRRNAPDPLPALVIGRLAVDSRFQGRGLARVLLRDALARCLRASHDVAFAMVLATPVDARAREFWSRWQFRPLPGDPTTMFLATQALSRAAGAAFP
jgi:GNAT superfamily N-acetyltransferase